MHWIALTAFLVAGCTEAAPRVPDVPRAEIGESVNMSNIDVSSEVGADRLLRRIRDAATARCDIDKNPSGEGMAARRQTCMHAAMASEVARVESPVLLARFRRVGVTMISAATPQDAANANRQALTDANRTASASLTSNSVTQPNGHGLTSDQLNHRESARIRAIDGTTDQDAADRDAALISPNE